MGGKLMNSSRLLGTDYGELREAEQNILEMETELNPLRNDFNTFNEAKFSLRKTRQELRELARRTKTEVEVMNILLDNLDNSTHPVLLTATIDRMKILMIETKKKLEGAQDEYFSALEAFSSLTSSVELTHQKVESYLEDKEYAEKVRSDCKIASWFTFGLCSLIHHFVNEVPLEEARVEVENLETMSEKLTERAKILNRDINEAIGIMDEEIKLIDKWANSAELVRKNIDEFPEETLRLYEPFRVVFKNGLDDLKKAAENFLAQPMHIL